MALCEVVGPELGWGLVQAGVGCEDRAATLPLVANDTTLRSLASDILPLVFAESHSMGAHTIVPVDVWVRSCCRLSRPPLEILWCVLKWDKF